MWWRFVTIVLTTIRNRHPQLNDSLWNDLDSILHRIDHIIVFDLPRIEDKVKQMTLGKKEFFHSFLLFENGFFFLLAPVVGYCHGFSSSGVELCINCCSASGSFMDTIFM